MTGPPRQSRLGWLIEVRRDAAEVHDAAVDLIARVAAASDADRGGFRIALAGGETPRGVYERLAVRPSQLPWERTDVFFGDERCVPPGDPRSNQAMARAALLSRVPIPPDRIHAVDCRAGPGEAASRYDAELRRSLSPAAPHAFDLALLGIGADGHAASLFPGDAALEERNRWAVAVRAPPGVEARDRVTLTLPLLERSRQVVFLVTGAGKQAIVRRLLDADAPTAALPATLIRGVQSTILLTDRAAAGPTQ